MPRPDSTPPRSPPAAFQRRAFLQGSAGAVLGLQFVQLGCENNTITPIGSGIEFSFISQVDVEQGNSLSTSGRDNARFHFVQIGGRALARSGGPIPAGTYDNLPIFSEADWNLTVDGDVTQALNLGFQDLVSRSADTLTILKTLRCVFDDTSLPGLIGTALWTGVPVRTLIQDAGVDPNLVNRFRFHGRDGFNNNLLYDEVMDETRPAWEQPMLAWRMNDLPVPHAHGGPVRLIIPGKLGYKNIKWIERIEATADDSPFGTYQRGDAYQASDAADVPVWTKATNPVDRQEIPAGSFRVFGFSISGQAAIQTIEIQIDDGPWEPVQVIPVSDLQEDNPRVTESAQFQQGLSYPYRDVWTLFRFDWQATPGPHTLRFRATDSAGNTQPETDPRGDDGVNNWWVIDVEVRAGTQTSTV